jgi:hypothetical protein
MKKCRVTLDSAAAQVIAYCLWCVWLLCQSCRPAPVMYAGQLGSLGAVNKLLQGSKQFVLYMRAYLTGCAGATLAL